MILTYLLMAMLFYLLGVDKFYLNAVIPTIGFVLSTLSLGWLKNIWINHKRSNK
ncbi:hypothetical protein HYX70_01840 [Candidatus Saccharibacteria bacterium]|nr:hypothetical protein [Candidatus Saccharibacteria bacterium]